MGQILRGSATRWKTCSLSSRLAPHCHPLRPLPPHLASPQSASPLPSHSGSDQRVPTLAAARRCPRRRSSARSILRRAGSGQDPHVLCVRLRDPPDVAARVRDPGHFLSVGSDIGLHQGSGSSIQSVDVNIIYIFDINVHLRSIFWVGITAFVQHYERIPNPHSGVLDLAIVIASYFHYNGAKHAG